MDPSSEAFFLVLRRMRLPLVVLISIFSISVVGLSLIPGESADGQWRMGLFDAFYFMSYTATTIGYGEIPQAFNDAQRMWVTVSIYLTVIGWAYAFGTLFALLQDRAFRLAIAAQRFRRQVRRLREPFWLLVGHGQTGARLGRWLDELGRQFVALDLVEDKLDTLDLGAYSADVPALAADARDPDVLVEAGLLNPQCAGVLALTDDDEANLAVTMAASLLRPGLPVIVRALSADVGHRLAAFGDPTIINPFDRFGDHFAVALRAPATEQLAGWLTLAPGEPLPRSLRRPGEGVWVVCGYGRFGREVVRDLRADGVDIVVFDVNAPAQGQDGVHVHRLDGTAPGALSSVGIADAVGFVAATDNDVTNLSVVAAARKANPDLFVVARQNRPANADLFAAMRIDLLMIETDVVVQEAVAHIATPLLWRFLAEAARQDDAWSRALIERLVRRQGRGSPQLWHLDLTPSDAPALARRLQQRPEAVRLGDILRDPADRSLDLQVVALMVLRGNTAHLAPADDVELFPDDRILLAGQAAARHSMESTLALDSSLAYVLNGDPAPSSWVWRQLTGMGPHRPPRE